MKLNKQIILQLIKEEIEKNILQELRSEETDAVAQIVAILTRLDAEKMNTDSVMDEAEKQFQAAQQAANADATPANRDGINEMGCGAPDTNISMGVDHSDDHEGNMAKRQMFKTAEYAAEIFDNIQDGDEFPAWIQSKMTKIADYIGAVKHYLEYDEVVGERKLTKAEKEKREEIAKAMEEEDPDIDMSKKMAIATAQAKKSS